MSVLYGNFLSGTTTDNPLTVGATTINSANFANLPEVASPDTMWLVLDPEGANGAPEIVQVTAHSTSATSVTVVRAQQSTTAREHPASTVWRCALTRADAESWLVSADLDAALADYATTTDVTSALAGYATTAYADALGTNDNANNSIMRRDSGAKARVATATTSDSILTIANRNYVDTRINGSGGDSGNIDYWKIGNMVFVWGRVGASGATNAIPSTHRPTEQIPVAGVDSFGDSCRIWIETNGNITVNGNLSSTGNAFTAVYLTAG